MRHSALIRKPLGTAEHARPDTSHNSARMKKLVQNCLRCQFFDPTNRKSLMFNIT